VSAGEILGKAELERYADAIANASLSIRRGDTLIVQGAPAHRELMVAIAAAGYRAGARVVDAITVDPLVRRARLEHGRDEALGVVTPWAARRLREMTKDDVALAAISGESDPGYLDGIAPKRIRIDFRRSAADRATASYRRAHIDMRTRWTIAAWPTDPWAARVYPELDVLKAKRRLARDLLWFCRLTDEDGPRATGWIAHERALARRSAKLTKLALTTLELRGPGTELALRLVPGTIWVGGGERTRSGVRISPNMPTEETFTSPHAGATEGTFTCTFPLSFQGRLIEGLRGEFRSGRLIRLEAKTDADRDFVAAYIDSDPKNGRRLGEIALVDSTSRIGMSGRTYFNTLLDENAAAHIAFGQGFVNTRGEKPARNVNQSQIHLDVMIGSPDFEATGIDAKGRRVPVIEGGLWKI
jgi:aminopeptidase